MPEQLKMQAGSVKLGISWLKLGSTQRGSTRLGLARRASAWRGAARLGSGRRGSSSARLRSARLGSVLFAPALSFLDAPLEHNPRTIRSQVVRNLEHNLEHNSHYLDLV